MGRRNYKIRNVYAPIWYMRKQGGIPEMRLHPRARMKKNFHWMERKIKEKERNPNLDQNLVKGARRNICQKLNASIVMNSSTIPWSVHTKGQEIIPHEEEKVRLWLNKLRLTLPSLHAWST